jgi:hypothetical protein
MATVGTPGSIKTAKSEIAALLLEKSKLSGEKDAPLRSLLEKNINQKILEFKEHFGEEINPEEMKVLVHQKEKGIIQEEKEQTAKEEVVRTKENDALSVNKERFKKEMGDFHQLEDTYLHDHDQAGSGVQWTADEQYVLLRPFEDRDTPSKTKNWIFNTKTNKFLNIHPENGSLSAEGHLYAEYDGDKFTVQDLDTGKKWGPFDGKFTESDFTQDLIVTEKEDKKSMTGRAYTAINFRSGKSFTLGKRFTLSRDKSRAVREKEDGEFEVVDLKTGKTILSRSGKHLPIWVDGGYGYRKDGKSYFVRLSDLKEVELPKGLSGDSRGFSSDESKLIFKQWKSMASKEELVTIFDLNTRKTTSFAGFDEFSMHSDEQLVLIKKYGKNSVLLDLKTMQSKELPGNYDHFSPNGRWVYDQDSRGSEWQHRLYDTEAQKPVVFKAGFDLDFIGKTNYFVTQDVSNKGKKGSITYLNDGTNWPGSPHSLAIGEREAKPSPSGKFLLTYEGGKLKLLELSGIE